MQTIVMTRVYKTYFEFDVETEAEAFKLFNAMNDEDIYGEEAEQMNVDEETIEIDKP